MLLWDVLKYVLLVQEHVHLSKGEQVRRDRLLVSIYTVREFVFVSVCALECVFVYVCMSVWIHA